MSVKSFCGFLVGLSLLVGTLGCKALSTNSGLTIEGEPLTKREVGEGLKELASAIQDSYIYDPSLVKTKLAKPFAKCFADLRSLHEKLQKDHDAALRVDLFSAKAWSTKKNREAIFWMTSNLATHQPYLVDDAKAAFNELAALSQSLGMTDPNPGVEDRLDEYLGIVRSAHASNVKLMDLYNRIKPEYESRRGKILFTSSTDMKAFESQIKLVGKKVEALDEYYTVIASLASQSAENLRYTIRAPQQSSAN